MRACRRAGLRVPEVLADDDGELPRHDAGLVMRRVAGETIPRRILRGDEFAAAREVLVGELGRVPRRPPRDRPRRGARAPRRPSRSSVWDKYQRARRPQPDVRAGLRLAASPTARARTPTTIVHGDLRVGNLIVGPTGLAAVIDWELVHARRPARGPRLVVPQGVALR